MRNRYLAGINPAKYLFLIFALVLLLSAQQMVARRKVPARASDPDIGYSAERLPLGMTLMYGAGLISALLGIGSGVLKIPAMDTALRLPIKVSSATSNFMIGVTAAASAGAYFVRGDILTSVAAPIALGSVLGAVLGARILMKLPSDKLRIMFVCILVILSAQMMLAAFGINLIERAP